MVDQQHRHVELGVLFVKTPDLLLDEVEASLDFDQKVLFLGNRLVRDRGDALVETRLGPRLLVWVRGRQYLLNFWRLTVGLGTTLLK